MDVPGWDIRAHAEGRSPVSVRVRRHGFVVGAPIHFDEEYDAITALEYAMGALAGDVVDGFRSLARKRRVEVDQVEALLHGELENALMYLGVVGEEGSPAIESLALKCYVSSLAEEADVQSVWAEALLRSPLAQTFLRAGVLTITMQIII
jgi:hypothetical protein